MKLRKFVLQDLIFYKKIFFKLNIDGKLVGIFKKA